MTITDIIPKIYVTPVGTIDQLPALDKWGQGQIKVAKECVRDDGDVDPVFIFLAPDPTDPKTVIQGIFPLREFFTGTAEEIRRQKVNLVSALQHLLQMSDAFACVMVAEAWVKYVNSEKELAQIRAQDVILADKQDMVEVLYTIFETHTEHEAHAWEIRRDETQAPEVGETPLMSFPVTGLENRFGTFLFNRQKAGPLGNRLLN